MTLSHIELGPLSSFKLSHKKVSKCKSLRDLSGGVGGVCMTMMPAPCLTTMPAPCLPARSAPSSNLHLEEPVDELSQEKQFPEKLKEAIAMAS